MKNLCKSMLLAAAVSVATVGAVSADPVEKRKAIMKDVVKAMKASVPMAKGEKPYDAAAAKAAMKVMNEAPDPFVKLFEVDDSGTDPDTEASPKIWQNKSDFEAKAMELKTASAAAMAAADKGQEAFKGALFGQVAKTCKSCHEAYRIKKN